MANDIMRASRLTNLMKEANEHTKAIYRAQQHSRPMPSDA